MRTGRVDHIRMGHKVCEASESSHKEERVGQSTTLAERVRESVVAKRKPEPRWCPAGLSKTQRRRLQKLGKDETKRE
jgi:hypothetical protein